MPDLIEEDSMSVDSVLPNEGEVSTRKSFNNIEWHMLRRSNRIKANQDKNKSKRFHPLTSTTHELIVPTTFLSSILSNETRASREVQKEPHFKDFVK